MADSTFLSMIKVTFMTTQLENDCKISVSLQKNCNNWFQKLYLNKPNDFWNNIVWTAPHLEVHRISTQLSHTKHNSERSFRLVLQSGDLGTLRLLS